MDLIQFESEIRKEISRLSYTKNIIVIYRSPISLKGTVEFEKKYKLMFFFNASFNIVSFSLIFEKQRIWAIDRDNRIGWHIHPVENPNNHIKTSEKSIRGIIDIFDAIFQTHFLNK